MKPDYSRLYVMERPYTRYPTAYQRLTIEDDPRFQSKDYDTFSNFVRGLYKGEIDAEPPLQLRLMRNVQPAEIMWSDYSPVLVISHTLVKLFKERGFTGWGTYSVAVKSAKGADLPGYLGLAVTGRAGHQDYRRGVVVDKPPVVSGGAPYQVLRGEYFKDDEWDGSDFFVMGFGGHTPYVTERVVQAFNDAGVTEVEFTSLTEHETNLDGLKIIIGSWPPEE